MTLKHAYDYLQRTEGFLNDEVLCVLSENEDTREHTRLLPVMVRCCGGRFTAPAQDVAHFINIIEAQSDMTVASMVNPDRDYVRDVSMPVGGMQKLAGIIAVIEAGALLGTVGEGRPA